MSQTSDVKGIITLPSLKSLLAQAKQAIPERMSHGQKVSVLAAWAVPYAKDIDDFNTALTTMLGLEVAAQRLPNCMFDGQLWVPDLITVGRLIRKRGWIDIVQGYASGNPTFAEQAFIRLLLDIADGRDEEADVRRCVTEMNGAELVAAMSWQYPSNSWNVKVKERLNAELRSQINPVPPVVETTHGAGKGAKDPDGPFGADGFRFAGVTVKFASARTRYKLVQALWDSELGAPAAAQPVQDVILRVYDHDNNVSDAAFRQLCSDARGVFQKANCPLDIKLLNSTAQLIRV